jgi:PKD repeat protein
VSFSGAGSSDPQGETLTYAWNFGDNGTGTGVSPTHTYTTPGTYTVSLTVTNTSNLTATATSRATIAVAPLSDVALTGLVYGGSTPIVGAHVYLFAANTTGYGGAGLAASSSNASVSLLSAAETGTSDSVGAYVATGVNGGFSLTGDYTCSSGQQLYLYALGGNNGAGTNAAAGLMAAIGSCPASGSPAISATVNEVTTVAAAYAFAGFATDATHVSSSGTALAQVGIANAFANAANLASLSTGTALATTPSGNGLVPQTEIDTLANILASCVNTASSCSTLLATATADGTATGTKPTDTATAAINIAHHPGANVAALYGMASGVFTPKLSAQPNDWTVSFGFTDDVTNGTIGIAIDGSGNAWVVHNGTVNNGNTVTELSSSGSVLSGATGYTGGGLSQPGGIAIDGSGNAWIANYAGESVTKLSNSGSILSGTNGYTVGGRALVSIAIDAAGNAWISDFSGVAELSNSGTILSGANGYSNGGSYSHGGVAIDGAGNAWVANPNSVSLSKYSSSGTPLSPSGGFPSGGLSPGSIAIDSTGNVWVANPANSSLSEFSNSGTVITPANGLTGVASPTGIAIDGSGNVWVTNGGSTISEFSNLGATISPTQGFTGTSLYSPSGIAIDGSGNVWVTNEFPITGTSLVISEFIGVAAPVITPIVAGLPSTPTANGSSRLGTRP